MNLLFELFIAGISMGAIYALMAMGLILIVRAVGVLNFAQGDLFMLGAYITYTLTVTAGMPIWVMAIFALIIFAFIGVGFMFCVYWPLKNVVWPATITISTLGASLALKELARFVWGPFPLRMEPIIPGHITIGTALISYQYIVIIAVSAVLIFLVFFLFEKMHLGRIMQAAAQDRYAAELLGIPTIVTIAATYIISVTLSSIGGYLAAPIYLVSQTLGSMSLRAFAGIVVGGFGSIKGAVIGSLLIGVIEAFSVGYITTTYKDAIVFLVLILVLLVRPTGIFGERISEKA